MKRIFLAIIFLLFASPLWGASRYFSTSGDDDTGDGSIGTPYKTIAKANTVCANGDICYFKKGDTWTSSKLNPGDNNITYNAYGTGAKPIITGSGADYAFQLGPFRGIVVDGIEFKNTSYRVMEVTSTFQSPSITIQNSKITGLGTTDGEGVRFFCNSHDFLSGSIVFTNNEISTTGIGVNIAVGTDCTIIDPVITYNNFHDIGAEALEFSGLADTDGNASYGVTISNNTFTNIARNAIYIQAGIRYIADHPSVISYNTATNIGCDGVDWTGCGAAQANINAFQLNYINTVTVEHNSISNVYTSAPDGNGIILDIAWVDWDYMSTNVIVRYNIVTGCNAGTNQAAGIDFGGTTNSTAYYNISYGNGIGYSCATSHPTGNTFYNNVSYGNSYGVFTGDLLEKVGGVVSTWKNNIISDNDYGFFTDQYTLNQFTESYNLLYNNPSGNNYGWVPYYPTTNTFDTNSDGQSNTMTWASPITLAAGTYTKIGAWFPANAGVGDKCTVGLYTYSTSEAALLASGEITDFTPSLGWIDVNIDYTATAGNYYIFVACNGNAWKYKYNASSCTLGASRASGGYVYSNPPTTPLLSGEDSGCMAVRAGYMADRAISGTDKTGNPLFVNSTAGDFRLKSGSPSINAGTDVSLTTDYRGRSVPIGTAPDIGAYEVKRGVRRMGASWVPTHLP